MARFVRSSGNVPKFSDYTHYKPYLQKDFEFRCAYCGMTEASVFGISVFGADHFRPQKLFPDLISCYENLYYCCNDCNRYKGPVWPPVERMAEGFFFPDPCVCDPFVEHLLESADGKLEAITKAGVFSLESLAVESRALSALSQKTIGGEATASAVSGRARLVDTQRSS